MGNCANCKHSRFDETWGEYRCLVREHRMYILLEAEECPNYKKRAEKNEKKERKERDDERA